MRTVVEMPVSAAFARPEDLVENLSSQDTAARLKALREVKNQIIGNKSKKLSYIKLGAVPRVVEILASVTEIPLLVQSAAAVGSFACGIDAGVKAVVESGVLPHLLRMLSNEDTKVVEAGARTLKMIFRSTHAPKSDMINGSRLEFILQLLDKRNDCVSEVAACVLARCCETSEHQRVLANAGGLEKLVRLLDGSVKKQEAGLDALAALVRGNKQLSQMLVSMDGGRAYKTLSTLVRDKLPRTRLLACKCLANTRQMVNPNNEDWELKIIMVATLVKLLDEPNPVGEEAPTILADLIQDSQELQNAAFCMNAIEKLAAAVIRGTMSATQLEGLLRALAELCSGTEDSRRQLMEMQATTTIIATLGHTCSKVRAAACVCVRNLSRSVKNLRTGLAGGNLVVSFLGLLRDPSPAVQALALTSLGNMVLDFTPQKAAVVHSSGISQLVQLAQSNDSSTRCDAVWALQNVSYLAEAAVKNTLLVELSVHTLSNLLCDSSEAVQEHAMALFRNLVCGVTGYSEHFFAHDGPLLSAVKRHLCLPGRPEICLQALYVLSNLAAGNADNKEAALNILTSNCNSGSSILMNYLQDMSNPNLRIVALWCVINLTFPGTSNIGNYVMRLQDAGIELQLRMMMHDPCFDVQDRVSMALEQLLAFDMGAPR